MFQNETISVRIRLIKYVFEGNDIREQKIEKCFLSYDSVGDRVTVAEWADDDRQVWLINTPVTGSLKVTRQSQKRLDVDEEQEQYGKEDQPLQATPGRRLRGSEAAPTIDRLNFSNMIT